jgi:hypothetical protein
MNEITNWSMISLLLLVASLILALVSITKKKLNMFITAIAIFMLFIVCGLVAVYKMAHKSIINMDHNIKTTTSIQIQTI